MADRTPAQPPSSRRGEVGRAARARRRHVTGEPISAEHTAALQRYLDDAFGDRVAIHAVDWRSCGLGDMAHPGNYLSRQCTRWLTQLDSYGGRDLPASCRISDWLEAHRPADQPSTLCHGDYKLDNLLFALDA